MEAFKLWDSFEYTEYRQPMTTMTPIL